MLDFINKLNDKDAITDAALNPRTSMHVTKKTQKLFNKIQKDLAKKDIKVTHGQIAHAAAKIATLNKEEINAAKADQLNNDLQAKLDGAVRQIGRLKSELAKLKTHH
jgi:hypothetical protein